MPLRKAAGSSLALLCGALVLLTGCGRDAGERAAGPFTNPVYDRNFPDPFVLEVNGTYFAYATNSGDDNVQSLRSDDLVAWTPGDDVLATLGAWAAEGRTWAPEVLRRTDGQYVLYYTAFALERSAQCIGRARAGSPSGPFVDRSAKPLVCQTDEGGSIDASPFRDDDGSLYLLWKNDGNCCGSDTFIYAQRLSSDGLRLVGRRVRLVKQDAAWEGPLVEAPTLWKHDGRYYLFFSANVFDSASYGVGYAACGSPLGPCRDSPDNPILATACAAVGPGHQALVNGPDGQTWIVYHAWPPDAVGSLVPGRVLWLDRLIWQDEKPVVEGPTCGAQPRP